jgi:hypothetical protein
VSEPTEDQHPGGVDRNLPGGDQPAPPVTGEPTVDRAVESLRGLESAPLADHHDRLARVHEDLHGALNADHPGSGS